MKTVTIADVLAGRLESDVAEDVDSFFSAMGCEILVTNAGVRGQLAQLAKEKGAKVGQLCTPGVPDRFYWHPSWPRGCWLGIELKRPKGGRVSPAQAILEQKGAIYIVRSIDEAQAAYKAFKADIRRNS